LKEDFYFDSHEIEKREFIEEKITTVSGEQAFRKYKKGRLLGRGGFAKCYEVTYMETKKVLAAKIIEKSSLTKRRAKQKVHPF
jgi:polo-like kinase 1